jgi:hypothetical protein
MPPRRVIRLLLLFAAPFFTAVAAPASSPVPRPTSLDAVASLPASNPYREAMLRLGSLSREDRDQLANWISPPPDAPAPQLPAPLRALAAELAASVRTVAAHPRLDPAHWPFTPNPAAPEDPTEALTFLRLGTARDLARLAVRHADELPPSEAIDYYAAAAQFARQQRAAPTAVEQLTGVAIEGVAHAAASRRLGEFSASDLQRLSAAWDALHPRPNNAEVLAAERDLYLLPLAQNILLPGLRALLADPDAGLAPDSASSDAGFTRDLRLSGLVNLGDGEQRILLENTRSGEHLSLRLGRPVDGIELLSLDFERRLAVIRRGSQQAEVHLQSKRIVERKGAAATLRERLAGLELVAGRGAGDETLRQILEFARRHPDGPEGYVRDYIAAYDESAERQVMRAYVPVFDETQDLASDDPLLALTAPAIGRIARTLNNSATASVALQAAIHHRLLRLDAAPDAHGPTDPWSPDQAAPFVFEPTSDGGFLLRSVYEIAPETPLSYKFAAPDSGFIRTAPKK